MIELSDLKAPGAKTENQASGSPQEKKTYMGRCFSCLRLDRIPEAKKWVPQLSLVFAIIILGAGIFGMLIFEKDPQEDRQLCNQMVMDIDFIIQNQALETNNTRCFDEANKFLFGFHPISNMTQMCITDVPSRMPFHLGSLGLTAVPSCYSVTGIYDSGSHYPLGKQLISTSLSTVLGALNVGLFELNRAIAGTDGSYLRKTFIAQMKTLETGVCKEFFNQTLTKIIEDQEFVSNSQKITDNFYKKSFTLRMVAAALVCHLLVVAGFYFKNRSSL